jgi:hypothetical protein
MQEGGCAHHVTAAQGHGGIKFVQHLKRRMCYVSSRSNNTHNCPSPHRSARWRAAARRGRRPAPGWGRTQPQRRCGPAPGLPPTALVSRPPADRAAAPAAACMLTTLSSLSTLGLRRQTVGNRALCACRRYETGGSVHTWFKHEMQSFRRVAHLASETDVICASAEATARAL